jgi:hypothetical protein
MENFGIDATSAYSLEVLRGRLHAYNPNYVEGERIADRALAEEMAYAEKPFIDQAIAQIALTQHYEKELVIKDDTPYASIRRNLLHNRIENSGREACKFILRAEKAAWEVEEALRSQLPQP